ncbi:hypothetical protein WJX72_007155 [[Myrmecia] bisecta]|uniref:Uncharacterized protein n=1 Tax=[Myrmecia] bisecta TaxID=41462 RepID=A0AAW1QFE9_9CHLO
MRVRVFETDDPNSEPPASLGAVRDVDLGQEGATPRQILDLLSQQFPDARIFAFNSQDQELPGWEEVTEANAGNLPAFLADRKQLKAVRGGAGATPALTTEERARLNAVFTYVEEKQQKKKSKRRRISEVDTEDWRTVEATAHLEELYNIPSVAALRPARETWGHMYV